MNHDLDNSDLRISNRYEQKQLSCQKINNSARLEIIMIYWHLMSELRALGIPSPGQMTNECGVFTKFANEDNLA